MRGAGFSEGRSRSHVYLVACVALVMALTAASGHAYELRILRRPVLPDSIRSAGTIRYFNNESVLIACGDGTLEVPTIGTAPVPRMVVPISGPRGLWSSEFVAVSSQFIAVGAPAYQICWMLRDMPEVWLDMAVDSPVSLDVWGDRLLLLGSRKGLDGKAMPDGSMAWIGSLNDGLRVFKPVLLPRARSGRNPLGLWQSLRTGHVRFMVDGSFVIVPGAESGVYLHAPDDHLVRVWESEPLGIDVAATDSIEEGLKVAASLVGQRAFLNARRVVDAVLPLAQGPGLVIRRVSGGRVHWMLKLLRRDGTVLEAPLPLEVDSEVWRVAGDVRGNKVMFLLYEFAGENKTRAHPRLVEMEVVP